MGALLTGCFAGARRSRQTRAKGGREAGRTAKQKWAWLDQSKAYLAPLNCGTVGEEGISAAIVAGWVASGVPVVL